MTPLGQRPAAHQTGDERNVPIELHRWNVEGDVAPTNRRLQRHSKEGVAGHMEGALARQRGRVRGRSVQERRKDERPE